LLTGIGFHGAIVVSLPCTVYFHSSFGLQFPAGFGTENPESDGFSFLRFLTIISGPENIYHIGA